MAVTNSDLKFYLTGAEPSISQTSPSLSVGGFISTSEISPNALLAANMGVYDTSLTLATTLGDPTALSLGDEIVTTESSGTSLTVVRSQFETFKRFHVAGDVVYDVSNQRLFNASLNESGKQYRCVAVKNTHSTSAFFDLTFLEKHASRNESCSVRFAVEIPRYDIVEGSATSGSTISLVDNTLIGMLEEEFIDSVLTITSGTNINLERQIASFDSLTGAITFLTAVPEAIEAGTSYRVENSPAQKVVSGLVSPVVGNSYVSSFGTTATGINFGATRTHGAHLYPNEVVYLWLERTVIPNAEGLENNRVYITVQYKTS